MQPCAIYDKRRRVQGMGRQVQDHLGQDRVHLRWAGVHVDAAEKDGGTPCLLRRCRQRPAHL